MDALLAKRGGGAAVLALSMNEWISFRFFPSIFPSLFHGQLNRNATLLLLCCGCGGVNPINTERRGGWLGFTAYKTLYFYWYKLIKKLIEKIIAKNFAGDYEKNDLDVTLMPQDGRWRWILNQRLRNNWETLVNHRVVSMWHPISDARTGGPGGPLPPPPIFGRSVNPISTREGRLSPLIATPPIFFTFRHHCQYMEHQMLGQWDNCRILGFQATVLIEILTKI